MQTKDPIKEGPKLKPMKVVLKPGVVYSGDNGNLFCAKCAGMTPKFTGRDRSGLKVQAMNDADAREWLSCMGKPLACESGCTTHILK